MSRYSKKSSLVVACSVLAVLSVAWVPATASAKGGSGPSMGFGSSGPKMGSSFSGQSNKFSQLPVSQSLGKMPITKNVGNLPITKLDKFPVNKIGKLPINKIDPIKKIDPISKIPFCNPIDPCFCHHDCCCHPHCHWPFPWLVVGGIDVVEVDAVCDPVYTLYYETADGIKVYGRYEVPLHNELLYRTEQAFDKLGTSWWLVSTGGELVDTNTGDKNAAVKSTDDSE